MVKAIFVITYLDSKDTLREVTYDDSNVALKASQYLINKGAKDVRVSIKFNKQTSLFDKTDVDKELA